MSYHHRTWFSHHKSILIIIASVISFFTLFNFHLIIFGCFYEPNGLVNINSSLYIIYPMWDFINLVMYNCLPFLFMVIFNSGFIYHLIHLRHIITIHKSRIPHQAISITLVITTFLFLGHGYTSYSCLWIFVSRTGDTILCTLNSMLYTYHILSFPTYIITFAEFRHEFIKMVTCNNLLISKFSLLYEK